MSLPPSPASAHRWLWRGYVAVSALALTSLAAVCIPSALSRQPAVVEEADQTPLVTGKRLSPLGQSSTVGSYPVHMELSPDGKWLLISSLGFRSQLSVLDTTTGKMVSSIGFNGEGAKDPKKKDGLFYGLAFGLQEGDGTFPVYAAQGSEDRIAVLTLAPNGTLTRTSRVVLTPGDKLTRSATGKPQPVPFQVAGIATNRSGSVIYAASNILDPAQPDQSVLYAVDVTTGKGVSQVTTPGYPYAVAALTRGKLADRRVYVTSEQQGSLSIVDMFDPNAPKVIKTLRVGAGAAALCLSADQSRLWVSSAGSDTLTLIDTNRDKVVRTILVRPADLRGLPAATPQGMALSPDEATLYVALSDLNAVAVVDTQKGIVRGYIPTGWYPTDVAVSPDGKRMWVTSAKGTQVRNPNGKPVADVARADRPQYIQNIIRGTVTQVDLPQASADLARLSAQVLRNNAIVPDLPQVAKAALANPGIEHVIYVIKENRTYDQVLGDLPQGNGDASLVLFGREVTPNLHALAERFVLLDNFYCCAEVSGDGWNWSTQGMVSAYNSRNVVYSYTGKTRSYEYEGTNTGVAVDVKGVPDVSRAPGGYIWDNCATHRVSFRNFGFFSDDEAAPRQNPEEGTTGRAVTPDKKALQGKTSPDFREFDLDYADSEGWVKHALTPPASQIKQYGQFKDPSRITAWRREWEQMVRENRVPRFQMLRLGRDHTSGTKAGVSSARAMVADNDYAVGQLVEAVSHSPLWAKTLICVVEDDAQNGYDHVDAHRSTAFVISPLIRPGTKDSRFYNTDSMLHTMENLLGLPPMNHYDATAPTINVFAAQPVNAAPYTAILPSREIIGEVNGKQGYRAADSAKINPRREESDVDEELNDILWHTIKGRNVPAPTRRYSVQVPGTRPARDDDD